MSHVVTWHQITTYSAELDVTIHELAEWAIAHAPVAMLGGTGSTPPSLDEIKRSLELNPHFLTALLLLLAKESGQGKICATQEAPQPPNTLRNFRQNPSAQTKSQEGTCSPTSAPDT